MSDSETPIESIPIQELEYFMPHRPPMVWVDEVLQFNESSGITQVTIRKDSLMLNGSGQVMPSALLEFFAQSYGYLQGARGRSAGRQLEVVYLAAVDLFALTAISAPKVGSTLIARLNTLRDLDPLHLVGGTVENQGGELLCELKIKGYAVFAEQGD